MAGRWTAMVNATLSRMIGRSDGYLTRFIEGGSPVRLLAKDRSILAKYFGVDERMPGIAACLASELREAATFWDVPIDHTQSEPDFHRADIADRDPTQHAMQDRERHVDRLGVESAGHWCHVEQIGNDSLGAGKSADNGAADLLAGHERAAIGKMESILESHPP